MGRSIRSSRLTRLADQGTLLAGAGLLLFVDLFLPWSQGCLDNVRPPGPLPTPFGGHVTSALVALCGPSSSGWQGFGIVAGLLAGLLVIWEGTRVARLEFGITTGYRSLISALLALGVLLFTAIEVVARLTWMRDQSGSLLYGGTFLWIALALALVIGAAGVVHWAIWEANSPLPPGSGTVAPGVGPPWSAGPPPAAYPVPPPVPPAPAEPPPPATQGTVPARVCPDCGRVNPADASFCSTCGRGLGANPGRRPSRRGPAGG